MTTVQTVVAVGDGDLDPLTASGKKVVRYDELLDGRPIEYDWPELDEKSAAAMCYTSGTTGNPKGVVYSHRSSYLHSMSVCAANGSGLVDGDRVLPVVPMFHANAWGQPYAAVMAGADLLLPDRFLQAEPLVDMIEQQRPTIAAAVPTIWNDVLQYLHANPGRDISSLRTVCCGGSAVPLGMMKEYEERYGVVIRQALGHDRDLAAGRARHAAAGSHRRGRTGHCAPSAGRVLCGVEIRIVDDDGGVLPNDGKAVGEIEVRGPWITGVVLPERRSVEVRRRLAADRRRRPHRSAGLHHAHRSRQGRHQVRRRMDLVGRVGAVHHGPSGGAGGRRGRRARRALAGTAVGRRRGQEDASATAEELRKHLCDKVARFWLPERWTFIDEVPKTSVGKFDKKLIRSRYADGAYDVVECRD